MQPTPHTDTTAQPQTFEAHAAEELVYGEPGVQYFEGETFPREGVADPVMVRRLHGARLINWGKAPADLVAIGKRKREAYDARKKLEAQAVAAPPAAEQLTDAELEAATAPSSSPTAPTPPAETKPRGKNRG